MSNWEQSFKDYLLFESIMEVFDSPYDVRGPFDVTSNPGAKKFLFDLIGSDGEEITMEVGVYPVNDSGAYEVAFKETGIPELGNDPYSSFTDKEKSTKVLSTVVNIIKDFMGSNEVNSVVYRAEPRRERAYETLFDLVEKYNMLDGLTDRGKTDNNRVIYIKKPSYELGDITLPQLT